MKNKKQELQEQLNAIAKQEKKEMVEKYYPVFKEKYEGRYFKYKNSYSLPKKPSDYWFMYIKVVEIKPTDIYDTCGNGVTSHYSGYTFQTDQYGNTTIAQEKNGYIHSLSTEISENEFNQAWNKMIEQLNKLP